MVTMGQRGGGVELELGDLNEISSMELKEGIKNFTNTNKF